MKKASLIMARSMSFGHRSVTRGEKDRSTRIRARDEYPRVRFYCEVQAGTKWDFLRVTNPKTPKASRPAANIGRAGGSGTADTDPDAENDVSSKEIVRPIPALPEDPKPIDP